MTFVVLGENSVKSIQGLCLRRGIAVAYAIAGVSGALFRSGCLRFGSFRIKSGALSPYYIDLAGLLSSPRELCNITAFAADRVRSIMATERVDKLASIELKGALILPSIGCQLDLPCVVVRKESKAYGVTGRTAGAAVHEGDRILLFDDVISEGLSKLEGIEPLEELGAKVSDILVVVNREQGGKETLEKLGYKVHALAKISELVSSLQDGNNITQDQARAVLDYIKKP